MSVPPIRRDTPPASEISDDGSAKGLLESMQQMLSGIDRSFQTFNEQSEIFNASVEPKMDITFDIRDLRKKLRDHSKAQDQQIKQAKRTIRHDFSRQISDRLRNDIQDQIRKEISSQVKEQVDLQIQDHIPIPLKQQAVDNVKQISEIKVSLANSEARTRNSSIRATSLDEPLVPILKLNGTTSDMFPADLRSLFSYDLAMTKALVKDFELMEDEGLETNFNRFMRHIGIDFQLVNM